MCVCLGLLCTFAVSGETCARVPRVCVCVRVMGFMLCIPGLTKFMRASRESQRVCVSVCVAVCDADNNIIYRWAYAAENWLRAYITHARTRGRLGDARARERPHGPRDCVFDACACTRVRTLALCVCVCHVRERVSKRSGHRVLGASQCRRSGRAAGRVRSLFAANPGAP